MVITWIRSHGGDVADWVWFAIFWTILAMAVAYWAVASPFGGSSQQYVAEIGCEAGVECIDTSEESAPADESDGDDEAHETPSSVALA